jgi:hypothetical protein
MSTLDTIVKDYDKNIMLRDCQRQAFEYLHTKLSHDRSLPKLCHFIFEMNRVSLKIVQLALIRHDLHSLYAGRELLNYVSSIYM